MNLLINLDAATDKMPDGIDEDQVCVWDEVIDATGIVFPWVGRPEILYFEMVVC
jgi:hypothetical protein